MAPFARQSIIYELTLTTCLHGSNNNVYVCGTTSESSRLAERVYDWQMPYALASVTLRGVIEKVLISFLSKWENANKYL